MSEGHASHKAQGRVGTVINGKWQVDARIGAGGMATVYSATHRNGLRAALKMLHGPLSRDPASRARFLREGYVANAVGHRGVVTVLDDGVTEDDVVFLVLELLEGETIDARRVRLGGVLPIDEALDLADQALDALAAAHRKGIVHRDVKPENVFLTNEGQIKLLDFGLARMKDACVEMTQTGVTIGTPEFMPPEQATGRRDAVDARSDVWGLGATLFTTITGRYVHDDARSLHEQLMASATRRSRPIRQLAPHVTPACARVIDRALELEMDDRWQSASDMQAALREARGAGSDDVSTTDVFTTDVTVMSESASTSAAPRPISHPISRPISRPVSSDKPASSDKTLHMPNAPYPARRRDATDMDATFLEQTHLAPNGLLDAPFAAPFTPATPRREPVPGNPPLPSSGVIHNHPQSPIHDTGRRHPASHSPGPVRAPSPYPGYESGNAVPSAPPHSYPVGPQTHAPMPHSAPRGPSTSDAEQRRATRAAVLAVAIILFIVCASMGAYVLWRAQAT